MGGMAGGGGLGRGAERDFIILKEKIELLDGSRKGGAIDRAAIRIEDFKALLQLEAKFYASRAAGTTPTKVEFDQLREDMIQMFTVLRSMADALQERVQP